MSDPVTFGRVDLTDMLDLHQLRPTVRLSEGVSRELVWPHVTFTAGRAGSDPGTDVIVCRGPEPALRWRAFSAAVSELARAKGVRMAVSLGGMPTPVSHRRAVRVLATATTRSLAQELEPVRLDYSGPTGAQTALQVALGSMGIPAVGLWAQVPHYLSGTVSPPAIRAVLSRLREVGGVDLDLRPLDRQVASYVTQIDEMIGARDDLSELVERLDAQLDDLATGDELVSEIEEFLREES
jgi:proteasome assembly chaperone (PAC2) family protein